jgi:hypothetical protein
MPMPSVSVNRTTTVTAGFFRDMRAA